MTSHDKSKYDYITDSMICAMDLHMTGIDSCYGDSGGPFIVVKNNVSIVIVIKVKFLAVLWFVVEFSISMFVLVLLNVSQCRLQLVDWL